MRLSFSVRPRNVDVTTQPAAPEPAPLLIDVGKASASRAAWDTPPRLEERIWCRVELKAVAELVHDYEPFRSGSWYGDVDWPRVAHAVDQVLQVLCDDGVPDRSRLHAELMRLEATLNRIDAEGLYSLTMAPIEITHHQLHNGGHRLKAMYRQGVPFVPGACMRVDIGDGIDAAAVYPSGRKV